MQDAQRAYQANLNVIETARDDGHRHPRASSRSELSRWSPR